MNALTLPTLALTSLALLLSLPAAAAECDHAPRLMQLLRGIDTVPTAADLVKVTEHPESALFAVAMDADLGRYERRRAVSLLSHFDTKTSEAFLVVIASAARQEKVRAMAIYTYVRGWAERAPKRVVIYARTTLNSSEVGDREAAARALRWVPTPAAEALLDEKLKTETSPRVLRALKRALVQAGQQVPVHQHPDHPTAAVPRGVHRLDRVRRMRFGGRDVTGEDDDRTDEKP